MARQRPRIQYPRPSVQSNTVSKHGAPLTNTPSLRPVRGFYHAEVPSWLQDHRSLIYRVVNLALYVGRSGRGVVGVDECVELGTAPSGLNWPFLQIHPSRICISSLN